MKVFLNIKNQKFVFKIKGPAEAAERHPPSDPSENLTKEVLVPSDCTTRKPYCHAELDSASIQRWKLPVSLDRFRNGLARLAKNGTAKSLVFTLCISSLAMTRCVAFTMAERCVKRD